MKRLLNFATALCLLCIGTMHAQTWVSLKGPKLVSNPPEITLSNSGTPTLYAADGAYLMKSTDAGVSWKGTVTDFTAPLATACKYADASVVVASKVNTFLRSSDGGSSWSGVTGDIEENLTPLRLVAATVTANASIMFLGREYVDGNFSVWQSANSGATWGPSYDFDYATDVYDLATFPGSYTSRRDFVFACGVNPGGTQTQSDPNTESSINGIFYSPNNGVDWYSKKLGGFNTYSVALLDRGESYDFYVFGAVKGGTYPGVYWSTDGGDSFEDDPIWDDEVVNVIRANNSDGNKAIFLGTDNEVYRSTDDGATFSSVSSFGDGDDDKVTSITIGTGTLVFAGTASSVHKSTDNGTTWTDIGKMNVSSVEGIGGTVWAVSRDNSFVGKTTDGGTNWSKTNLESAGANISTEYIHRVPSSGYLFAAGALGGRGVVYRSTDGSNFTEAYPDDPEFYETGKILTVGSDIVSSNSSVYAGGGILPDADWYKLFKSTNNGDTFVPSNAPTNFLSVYDLKVLDTSTRYIIESDGAVYKTVDGGDTWGSAILTASGVGASLAISPNVTTKIYAARSTGLWRSTNDGASWANKRGGNDLRVHSDPTYQYSGASEDAITCQFCLQR